MRPPLDSIRVRRLGDIDSTMLVARHAVDAGEIGPARGVMFTARSQSAGRGRLGRAWSSPPGGLWTTLVWGIPPEVSPAVLDGLGLRVGVACLRTVRDTLAFYDSPSVAQLKWPNDILIDSHKVCGTLTQIVTSNAISFLLIGVGINASLGPNDLPPASELRRPATSLSIVIGRGIDLAELESRLRTHLYTAVTTRGVPSDDLALARATLFGAGQPVEGRMKDGSSRRGIFMGLDDSGRPIVSGDGGEFTRS